MSQFTLHRVSLANNICFPSSAQCSINTTLTGIVSSLTSTAVPSSSTSLHLLTVYVVPTPSISLHLSTTSSCLPKDETKSTCGGGQRLEYVTVYFIISAISSVVLLMTATVVAISVLLWLRKRKMELRKRKSEPEVANNVTYHSYDRGNADAAIGHHTVNGNTAATIHCHTALNTKESVDTKNEAHSDMDITMSVNPTYNQVETSDDDSSQCAYDYVRTANMYTINGP